MVRTRAFSGLLVTALTVLAMLRGPATGATAAYSAAPPAAPPPCSASCGLVQQVVVPVHGAGLTLSSSAAVLTASADQCTGSARPGRLCATIGPVTVVNARGTDEGWSLTARVSDLSPTADAAYCPSPSCIPVADAGWAPLASVAHAIVAGDVAEVFAGPTIGPRAPGLSASSVLCSAPTSRAGGTFVCRAEVTVATPQRTPHGAYRARVTLTLA